jgi:hypothetical protein
MKKILLVLLLPCFIYAQTPYDIQSVSQKSSLSGLIFLAKDQTIKMNDDIVDYLTMRIDRIISVGGQKKISIAVEKEFKKRLRTRFVDGYLVQYAWTGIDVSLQKPRTKVIEFDFDKKLIDKKKVIVISDTVKVKKDVGLNYYFNKRFYEGTGKSLKQIAIGETKQNDNDDHLKPSDTKLKEAVKAKDEKENKKPDSISPGKNGR